MTEDRSNAITLAALGMFSGAAAWSLMNLVDPRSDLGLLLLDDTIALMPLSLLPGLVFGLVISLLLHRRGIVALLHLAGYVLAAGFAYFCAFHVAWHVGFFLSHEVQDAWPDLAGLVSGGISAGLVGSLLLGLMSMLLLRAPERLILRLPVLIGGAAGALLGLIARGWIPWGWNVLAFLVLWQGAYAASLAPLLRRARNAV